MTKQIGMVLASSLILQTVSSAYYPAQAPTLTFDEATLGARIEQAKEIFGRRNSKTELVKNTINRADLTKFVAAVFEKELPQQYKNESQEMASTLLASSAIHSLDPLLVLALIQQESKFHPDVMGTHGEIGLMQIKPDTARWIASRVGIAWNDDSTLFDPEFNIRIGTAYVSFLRERFNNHGRQYLAAYNMGPAALRERLRNKELLPTEYSSSTTQHYIALYQSWLRFDAHLVAKLD